MLWQYDSIKLLTHIRNYEVYEDIDRIEVVDDADQLIQNEAADVRAALADRDVIWASAPITANNDNVGTVWVASSTQELRRDTMLLLFAFGVLGLVLGGLIYWLPQRAMRTAQDSIDALFKRLAASQSELAQQSENLEHQVEARSSELRQAYRELQEKERNLRELSSRAVGMQEAERRAIARELHDSAGQSLTAIRIHLQLISDLLASAQQSKKAHELADRTTGMVDETVEEIRRAVNMLGPAVLDDVGLEQAVERAAEDLKDGTGVAVECNLELPRELDAAVETTCYRVVQESLTNVARHAEASRVEISIRVVQGSLELLVQDDGRGFDVNARKTRSRGLIGMRERLELLGGELTIDSALGQGTKVRAAFPLGAA